MTIVYQDERIVVAVKPNGVLSTDEPGGMPSLLRQTLGTDCIRTVHRLDAQTGGLMVFARSRKAAALLSEQVRERQFSKGYLAVVHGVPQPVTLFGQFIFRRPVLNVENAALFHTEKEEKPIHEPQQFMRVIFGRQFPDGNRFPQRSIGRMLQKAVSQRLQGFHNVGA